MTKKAEAAPPLTRPRKGGSYIRDKETGALTAVQLKGETSPPAPDAPKTKEG